MPLALVEGMAAGCACVGSDVLGVREVIDHEHNGLLVPKSDAQAMATALKRLLQDPALAQQLGQAARQQALSAYGREHMWGHYRALLAEPATIGA
jgi:glycosyltransferase involved in cell wall biosynthesis